MKTAKPRSRRGTKVRLFVRKPRGLLKDLLRRSIALEHQRRYGPATLDETIRFPEGGAS